MPAAHDFAEVISVALAPTRRNVIHWTSWLVTLSILLVTMMVISNGRVFGWEQEVTRWIQHREYPEWLFDATSNEVTDRWEGAFIVLVAGVSLLVLRQPLEAALVFLTFPLHFLANFPKALINRERPSELFEGIYGGGGGTSFASGHSEFAFTFYGFLAFLALSRLHGWPARTAIALLWLGLAAPVGFERIAEGKHWPLDVFVGYAVGIGVLSGLIWIHRAFLEARQHRHARTGEPDQRLTGWNREPSMALILIAARKEAAESSYRGST